MGTEIYIGTERADYSGDVTVVFSPGDIKDFASGRADSSYTIELPLTSLNKKLLCFSDKLNVFTEVSDPGYIIINGITVLKGRIIVVDSNADSASIIIQGSAWYDFFSDLRLRDIDLSAMDHVYSKTNIENSWSGSAKSYRYPMINFAQLFSQDLGATADWLPNDFLPMFRVVDILTKIFAPWTLAGDWLTAVAEKYILGIESRVDEKFIINKGLDVRVSSTSHNTDNKTIDPSWTDDLWFNYNLVSLQNEIIDEDGLWNESINMSLIYKAGTYNFRLAIETNWTATNKAQLTVNTQNISISMYKTDGITPTLLGQKSWNNSSDILTLGTFVFENCFVHLELGDYVYFSVVAQMNLTENSGAPQTVTLFLTTNTQLTLVWDKRCLYHGIGAAIDAALCMPDISAMDFVIAVKEAYNLRFTPDLYRQIVYIEAYDNSVTENVKVIDHVDHAKPMTEYIAHNYASQIRLKLKTDTSDRAVKDYVAVSGEAYHKDIAMTSLYTKKEIETYENSLFAWTVSGPIDQMGTAVNVLRIFGGEDFLSLYPYPAFRAVGYLPRLLTWVGLTAGINWYYDGTLKTTYPKATTEDMAALYLTNFLKMFHNIDRGKLVKIETPLIVRTLQEFITVVNDIDHEGFRASYEFDIDGETFAGYLNRIEFNGDKALMELIIKH